MLVTDTVGGEAFFGAAAGNASVCVSVVAGDEGAGALAGCAAAATSEGALGGLGEGFGEVGGATLAFGSDLVRAKVRPVPAATATTLAPITKGNMRCLSVGGGGKGSRLVGSGGGSTGGGGADEGDTTIASASRTPLVLVALLTDARVLSPMCSTGLAASCLIGNCANH